MLSELEAGCKAVPKEGISIIPVTASQLVTRQTARVLTSYSF